MGNLIIGIPTVKRGMTSDEYEGKSAVVLKATEEGKRSKIGFTSALCSDLQLSENNVELNIAVDMGEDGINDIYFVPTIGKKLSNRIGRQLRTIADKKIYNYITQEYLNLGETIAEDVVLDVEIISTMAPYSWAIRLINSNQEQSETVEDAIVEEETSKPSWSSNESMDSYDNEIEADSNEELAPW
jgi:hypothetical protein